MCKECGEKYYFDYIWNMLLCGCLIQEKTETRGTIQPSYSYKYEGFSEITAHNGNIKFL